MQTSDCPNGVDTNEGWSTGTVLQNEFTGALLTWKSFVKDASCCKDKAFELNKELKKLDIWNASAVSIKSILPAVC